MKKVTFLALSCLFVMMANFYTAKAQINCIIDDPSCTAWSTPSSTLTIVMTDPECLIIVDYKWRICNGVYEYIYTDFTAKGNCVQMADFSIYEYDFSSILEMADMIIAENQLGMVGHPYVPECEGSMQKMKRYAAACGVWVKCSYKVDVNATVEKDRGYVGDCPTRDANDYIDKWKWQSCGETCCSRTYDICWYTSPYNNESQIRVTQYPAVQVGECTDQGNFGPWDDLNTDYQCGHGC